MAAGLSGGGGVRRHAAAVAMAAAAAAGDGGGDGGFGDGITVAGDVGVPSGGGDCGVRWGRWRGHRSRLRGWRRAAASRDGGDGAKM